MIVHDHALFRQALAVVLERQAGFEVYAEASTLSEARSIVEQMNGTLDLAVVGLDVPDGDDLVRELYEVTPGASVLGLTANPDRVAGGAPDTVLTTEASVEEILATARRLVR